MTKNNIILFCPKSKIYEVAQKSEIHRRMRKENDFKPENNIKQNWSYGDLDNTAYFYLFFWTPLALFPDFTSFGKSTKSRVPYFLSPKKKSIFYFILKSYFGPVR